MDIDFEPTRAAEQLVQAIRHMGSSCLVALSGGVDSAVVAQAAWLAFPGAAVAVTGISPAVSGTERDDARRVARQIGIPHEEILTEEIHDAAYRRNAPDRCFHCKTDLYTRLTSLAQARGVTLLLNGANADDRGDYRPGMVAAAAFSVRSPLMDCDFGKDHIRQLAARWSLPIWDKPASPCLSSRIAYGVEVTAERLSRIEHAEALLRELLPGIPIRVRCHAGEVARIEVPLPAIATLAADPARSRVVEELQRLGFRAVTLDLEGFRTGNLNTLVPLDALMSSVPSAG